MCGICGIYNFDNNKRIDSHTLDRMTDIMKHRGPDDRTFYIKNNIGIGFCFLKTYCDQINYNPYKYQHVIIAFDGDIYNEDEIWKNLESHGYLKTIGDISELVTFSYLLWGENCFSKLNGSFALVIYDEKDNKLILVRDRFGSKPLYYHLNDQRIIFSTEIKGILTSGVTKSVNMHAVHEYLSARYTIGCETLFNNINKVMNNHVYTFCNGKVIKNKIWNFPQELSFVEEKETIEKLDHYIIKSVKQKTKGVDKIGLFLSGGIDSMSLVPILQNETDVKIFSYTASFTNNQDFDETSIAKRFATEKGIDHEICIISSNDYIDNLNDVIIAKDGPSCVNSEIAIYIILKLLKENDIKVAMGGDNADSIFAPAHNDIAIEQDFIRVQRLKRLFPGKLVGPFFEVTKKVFNKGYRLKDMLMNDLVDYYFWGYFTIEDRYNLYKKDFKVLLKNNDITREKLRSYFSDIKTQDFKRLLFAFHHDHYAVTNIMRVEHPSASLSLTYMLPYVDNNLLEIARSVPYSFINHPAVGNKYLLLKWAERYLSKETIYRKKKYAFNVPLNYWLKYESGFYSSIKETLMKKNSFVSTIMNIKELDIFIDQCREYCDQNEAIRLWRIYNLEKWHEIYFSKGIF